MILVTGGTGYIGSHTVVELLNEGFDVAIIDNLSNSNIRVLEGITAITGKKPLFEQFDLCDASLLNNFFKNNRVDAVIHFAAYKAVGESVASPLTYYHNNLVSLMNLLYAMSSYNVPALVFSSSCTVYGEPDSLPVTELAPIKTATSPYGNTKQICEEIIHDSIKAHPKLKSIALRYFNPIGAHESALIGELPIGVPNNLVPFITQTAFGLRDCLKVFGNDYDTPDGTCIRDYINVTDLAKAHIAALKRMQKSENESGFEVFNLGTGMGSSVLEVINSFEKTTSVRLNYIFADRRSGDVVKVYASTDKANKILGWKAEKSLDETLLSAWKWENFYRKSIAN
ncbi:MAG: UDP-glucose 4-epimerase GalE [Bacteroidetes bacterium RIFOXYA12_FULL_35_11]|nr:MAG: UDP-glucose 4-epimerase GalE [Bacteroidetes bacterium GWF2_35_48]OFY75327.1 MAG: UDP-glucose 4-epimerase GalE [Bacteroidetes bacterium RIFOXYA12_FULL_35_11]OFY94824.1 MAG: UDP-glucose 4-epimerase GalE [Bacteroidetes bacterium RIFOXYC12_FULL_35_7]OFY96914.1 MAG: UDP-glucose 4-epimerase GalE [Bacteroidetes bacterium RIFOXYB2_FULL_35_7]HBX53472.1 UDP-glucose 4-epimerase GalE [Bacteroidales bacterium]